MTNDVKHQPINTLTLEQAFDQAVMHHRAGQIHDAERLYLAILRVQPNHPDANHNLGLLAVQMQQAAVGLPFFQTALQQNTNNFPYWNSYIVALQESGQPDVARALMQEWRTQQLENPGGITPNEQLAQTEPSHQEEKKLLTLFEEGRYAESEAYARALTVRFPKNGIGWKVLGMSSEKQGQIEQALPAMEQAVALLEEDAEAYKSLGGVLLVYGRLSDAELACRRALQIKPDYAEAHSNLGIIFKMQGRLAEAEACYQQALKIRPDLVAAYCNIANMFMEQGRLAESEASYREAIKIKPDYADAHLNLGTLLNNQGRLTEAEVSYRRVIEIKPQNSDAHLNLGILLYIKGRLTEAEASFRRVMEIKPDNADAYSNLGGLLMNQGRLTEAEVSCRKALLLKPDLFEAHNNLGGVLMDQGRLAEAEASYRQAVLLKPDLFAAHNNLGGVLMKQGRPNEAEASCRLALLLKPDNAKALSNLGTSLKEQGRLSEAESSYRQALAFEPDSAELHFFLGNVLKEQDRLAEAEASCRRALQIKADYADACNNLGGIFREQGRLEEAEASYRQALAIDPDYIAASSNLLLNSNYLSNQSPQYYLEEARRFGVLANQRVTTPFTSWLCPAQEGRLRVGMVSGDLRRHPVGFFLESILSHIDQTKLELIAYTTSLRADALTERIRPHFSGWKSIAGMSDEDAARIVHSDSVQVLIDLSGHTAGNRLPVFAWKPAPVQVTWLGYFATTGIKQMDYLIGDPFVTPAAEDDHFCEAVWQLPETYLCFSRPEEHVLVKPLPALSGEGITFGCFNHLAKINDAVVALWSKVLLSVPNSRLFLKTKQLNDSAACEITVNRFANHGIEAGRLVLEGGSPRLELLEAYSRIDIALDPFPYPGGTTSVEALWMGVPVLTKKGDRFVSHVGESIAHNAGLSDWIAADESQYVEKAIAFAGDLPRLASLRASLRQQLLARPLFNSPRFARHFEKALCDMWKNWFETE